MNENVGKDFNDNLNDTINSTTVVKGHLQDTVISNSEKTIVDRGNNQICVGCHRLIAALIGMDATINATDPLYFAIGNSDEPTNQSDENLKGLLFRHKIDTENGDKVEIDGNILTITANFYSMPGENDKDDNGRVADTNYNTEWKECGIYKGDVLLNRKIHDTIIKASDVEIVRTFKFTF